MSTTNYINYLMQNYPLESDNVDSFSMEGGQQEETDLPNGGFPPIYICAKNDPAELFDDTQPAKREYSSHKTTISIKDIMEKRRKLRPI